MTDFHKALYTFWSGFFSSGKSIPAYLSGHVPPKTPFPYITFEVVEGDFLSDNILTAFGWFKAESGGNVNADAADFLDSVEAAIPQEGAVLPVGEGYAVLCPNGSNFLSYETDPEDRDIVGGRVSYEIHYYLLRERKK